MNKAELRHIFTDKRAELSTRDHHVFQDLLLIRFQELSLGYFNLVHAYLPLMEKKEPDPTPLLDWLAFRNPGMHITYSKINPRDFTMSHFLCDEDTRFEKNRYGIPEPTGGVHVSPEEIELAFVPLLAFDLQGNRVGYGKGYYDRFLDQCAPGMTKVGLSFFSPVDSINDIGFFDKKLDFCITPDRVYAF
jgi:5-formyltetrahydrofolate cyclo-ligase